MFDRCYCINSTIYLLTFGKLYGTIFCHRLTVSERVHIFLNIHLPGPSASRDSRWLPSFDSTSIFPEMTVQGGGCTTVVMQNEIQVPREMLKTEAVGRGFQHLSRDLANVNVLENNV